MHNEPTVGTVQSANKVDFPVCHNSPLPDPTDGSHKFSKIYSITWAFGSLSLPYLE